MSTSEREKPTSCSVLLQLRRGSAVRDQKLHDREKEEKVNNLSDGRG